MLIKSSVSLGSAGFSSRKLWAPWVSGFWFTAIHSTFSVGSWVQSVGLTAAYAELCTTQHTCICMVTYVFSLIYWLPQQWPLEVLGSGPWPIHNFIMWPASQKVWKPLCVALASTVIQCSSLAFISDTRKSCSHNCSWASEHDFSWGGPLFMSRQCETSLSYTY